MGWLAAGDYVWARLVVERGVAAVFAVAFVSSALQFPALVGESGLLPVRRFTSVVPWRRSPSLFYWRYSDRLLRAVCWTGTATALLVVAGVPQLGGSWPVLAAFLVLYALYLSIVDVGQIFYAFGWESLLLEAGFTVGFLGAGSAPPVTVIWLVRWLVFRLEFGAGLIKLRGDPCWRDLTCLYYHHETQPLPGPLSWWFHHLPKPLHRVEVAANHVVQLVVPFLLFAPQPVASVAALCVIVTQAWLVLSGNFSWLNVLTMLLAFSAVDDRTLSVVFGRSAVPAAPGGAWAGVVLLLTAVFAVLSYWPARNLLARRQLMNYHFNPLHLMGAYGAFGSITRRRYEIVVEGAAEPGGEWHPYEFKAKPGDVRRRPRQVAPYHLRLDWLMWFAAMATPESHPWFYGLVRALLRGDQELLKLLGNNPFPDAPPAVVRATLWSYRYTTREERRATGAWWERRRVASWFPPVSL